MSPCSFNNSSNIQYSINTLFFVIESDNLIYNRTWCTKINRYMIWHWNNPFIEEADANTYEVYLVYIHIKSHILQPDLGKWHIAVGQQLWMDLLSPGLSIKYTSILHQFKYGTYRNFCLHLYTYRRIILHSILA